MDGLETDLPEVFFLALPLDLFLCLALPAMVQTMMSSCVG
jgi:hypothetical protein